MIRLRVCCIMRGYIPSCSPKSGVAKFILQRLLIVALAIACSCSPALAKMYRCGNQYQERPCEGPKADPAASSAAKSDPQQQKETEAKRKEREQEINQAKCENYAEELADVERRIQAGADKEVMDQFKRRQKEMRLRIERLCKK
jgi:hypothetical protein